MEHQDCTECDGTGTITRYRGPDEIHEYCQCEYGNDLMKIELAKVDELKIQAHLDAFDWALDQI